MVEPEVVQEPEIEVEVEPEPEVVEALVEPEFTPEPEVEVEPEPEPEVVEALVEPEITPEPEVEAVEPEPEPEPEVVEALVEPEPEPEPETPEAAASTFELDELPKDTWVPIVSDQAPEAAEAAPVPEAAADEGAETDYIVEPRAEDKEPPKRRLWRKKPRKQMTAEEILRPEPPPGPLPDYIVDPESTPSAEGGHKPTPAGALPTFEAAGQKTPPPAAEPPHESEPAELPRASLGLPPLADYPSLPTIPIPPPEGVAAVAEDQLDDDAEPAEAEEPSRGGKSRRKSAELGPRGRRDRSASEPGDMSETVDWAGLSSRLSAYSLSSDAAPPSADADDAAEDDAEE